jgi:hypothetical protein
LFFIKLRYNDSKGRETMKNKTYEENKEQLKFIYKILKKHLKRVIKPSEFFDMSERQRQDYIKTGLYICE